MKRSIISLFLVLFACTHTTAQQRELDSLLKVVPGAKDDTDKVKLLKRISFLYSDLDPKLGVKYGEQSLALSERLHWEKGVGMALGNIGTNYNNMSDYPQALEYYFRALKIWEKQGKKQSTANMYVNISTVYASMGNYPSALNYTFRALELAKPFNDPVQLSSLYEHVATYYDQMGEHEKALEYFQNNLKTNLELGDSSMIALSYENIGIVYRELKNYALALENGMRSLSIQRGLGMNQDLGITLFNIAVCYVEKYQDEVQKGKENKRDLYQAAKLLDSSNVISKETDNLAQLSDGYKLSSTVDTLLGDYKNAFKHYRNHIAIRDSIFSSDKKVEIANLATQRETELKEKQIEINKLAQVQKQNERIMFIVGLGLLGIVIGAIARNYATQRKANKVKGELLKQKDMLMKEIHHRVKNNLQVISALLELQQNKLSDEGAKEAMTESTARVKSISLIHQKLYQGDNITTLEFSAFTHDLMSQVASVFKKPGQHIVLINHIPETVLDIDTAIPLGLILNELMTNSFKYAFNGQPEGSIEISLERINEQYKLVYRDSGPGLPAGINITKLKSLGMKVVQSLSKQIAGGFTYQQAEKTFVITFKDEAGRRMVD